MLNLNVLLQISYSPVKVSKSMIAANHDCLMRPQKCSYYIVNYFETSSTVINMNKNSSSNHWLGQNDNW